MEWYWVAEYIPRFMEGLWITIKLLVLSLVFGMALATPIGLVQVTGPETTGYAGQRILHCYSRNSATDSTVVNLLRTGVRIPLYPRHS